MYDIKYVIFKNIQLIKIIKKNNKYKMPLLIKIDKSYAKCK